MRKLLICVVALSLIAPAAQGAYSPEPPAPAPAPAPAVTPAPATAPTSTPAPAKQVVTVQTELTRINPMLYSNNFKKARTELIKINKAFPNNADVNNLLGYTSRKLKSYRASASYYSKALQINPNHLGALEYQGELFVTTKKIASAKSNLAKLLTLCGVNCSEYKDLKKAIGNK
jgi:tetratricopeptide (TPR) repeat protein